MNGMDKAQREYGDYQTPLWFCEQVYEYLQKHVMPHAELIFEPTCGIGNFLQAGKHAYPHAKLCGLEVNGDYARRAATIIGNNGCIFHHDFFDFDFNAVKKQLPAGGRTLIIGNPPWANNTTLSVIGSRNLPVKSNFKGARGLDAITGSANFDICEYMILQLMAQFRDTETTIAMLCKTSVARNIFQELIRTQTNCRIARVLNIDTNKVFQVSTDACLLILELTETSEKPSSCEVFSFSAPSRMVSQFGYRDGKFYSQLENDLPDIDGTCCFEWRQGIKHDCSRVMELTPDNAGFCNNMGERVTVEDALLYPLVKSSHLKTPILSKYRKCVLVTQKYIGQETASIQRNYPLTWAYLSMHAHDFDNRKSIIYKNSPRYSMFGIGGYAFAPYKVGISGFYKQPLFSLICGDKPVMLDDTCYFLPFDNYDDAYVAMLILNSKTVTFFLKSVSFADSKRPFTKKILSRVDFDKCMQRIGLKELHETELSLHLPTYINLAQLNHFDALIHQNGRQQSLAI